MTRLGIRREDKNIWERRVPLIPEDLGEILGQGSFEAVVQPSARRIFTDDQFAAVGARLQEDLGECDVVLAVKEIPAELFVESVAYVFFSHTIKAQPYNMAMLRRLLELKCTLIDYERIVDEQGRRLVFFSRQAGQAGMIDTLHLLGKRLDLEGVGGPISEIQMAYAYPDLAAAQASVRRMGETVRAHGLPTPFNPLVCGFAGYGNVSRGAQEVFDVLPFAEISPDALLAGELPEAPFVKVVFKEADMVAPRSPGHPFELQEYYRHPERYQSRFERFLPRLHVLINGIYWEQRYPRLVTNDLLKQLWSPGETPRLRIIGDVSCDIEGSIECTRKSTMPDAPGYVYHPETDDITMGVDGRGPIIMAVDNLPAELSHESSVHFSRSLRGFVPALLGADRSVPLERYDVPGPLRPAVIVYNGELTPDYKYLERAL